jgi:hypothetical protein
MIRGGYTSNALDAETRQLLLDADAIKTSDEGVEAVLVIALQVGGRGAKGGEGEGAAATGRCIDCREAAASLRQCCFGPDLGSARRAGAVAVRASKLQPLPAIDTPRNHPAYM